MGRFFVTMIGEMRTIAQLRGVSSHPIVDTCAGCATPIGWSPGRPALRLGEVAEQGWDSLRWQAIEEPKACN